MKSAYLVTESHLDTEVLKHLLPKDVVQNTEFVAAKGQYSARSLAGTILSERMRPVALVLNAETEDADLIQTRRTTISSLLRLASAGVPYEVFLAVPTVAAILHLDSVRMESFDSERLNSLSAEQIQSLQQHSLIQQITQFIAATVSQAA